LSCRYQLDCEYKLTARKRRFYRPTPATVLAHSYGEQAISDI